MNYEKCEADCCLEFKGKKMRYVLAPLGFVNGNLQYNKNVIIDTMRMYSTIADIVIFGEAFLQGFYAADFVPEHDEQIAVSQEDALLMEICAAARQYKIAISFGFIEKAEECFFSSQVTIDSKGNIIDVYRRVSPGWKEAFAGDNYREGKDFHAFSFKGKDIVVGLCGDLWFDENVEKISKIKPDIVFWPVYTDFSSDEWNSSMKYEYAEQASKVCENVLYVNSVCKDMDRDEYAKGGAAFFSNGNIKQEVPSGKETVLVVEV